MWRGEPVPRGNEHKEYCARGASPGADARLVLFWRAQMPFANFTVGQVFFAVVHDKLRPPLDAFHKAIAAGGRRAPRWSATSRS